MKYIKLLLLNIVIFSLLILIISLLLPSKVRISRAVDLNMTNSHLKQHILGNSRDSFWNPGQSFFPNKIHVHAVTDTSFISEKIFYKGKKIVMGWHIIPSADSLRNTLQWYMDIYLNWYPWEKFSGLLLEKRHGAVMEMILEKLKKSITAN